jgi:hypothetical protein
MEEERVPSVPAFSRCSGKCSPGISGPDSPKKPRVSKLRSVMLTACGRRFCARLLTFDLTHPPELPKTCDYNGERRHNAVQSFERTASSPLAIAQTFRAFLPEFCRIKEVTSGIPASPDGFAIFRVVCWEGCI